MTANVYSECERTIYAHAQILYISSVCLRGGCAQSFSAKIGSINHRHILFFFPQRCKKKQKNSSIKEPQMDVRQRLQFVDQVIKANMLNNSRWITDRWNNVPSKRKITGFTSLSIKGLRALFNSPNASSGLVGISSVWRNFSVLWTFFYRTQSCRL